MTVQQQQEIVDQVMHRMALRRGSSTRRDFEVACLVCDVIEEAGCVSVTTERSESSATLPSEALKDSTNVVRADAPAWQPHDHDVAVALVALLTTSESFVNLAMGSGDCRLREDAPRAVRNAMAVARLALEGLPDPPVIGAQQEKT